MNEAKCSIPFEGDVFKYFNKSHMLNCFWEKGSPNV